MGGFINNKKKISVSDKFGQVMQMNKLELGHSPSNVHFLLLTTTKHILNIGIIKVTIMDCLMVYV